MKQWLAQSLILLSIGGVLLETLNPVTATAAATPPKKDIQTALTSTQPSGRVLSLPMAALGDKNGYMLQTVKTERVYDFTRPTGWEVLPSSNIKVVFQHAPQLLPERSSLNVLVNNRILKTITLGKDNVLPNTVTIPIPPGLLKDKNTLAFQVDQHYTYQCEDPFSGELWTTLLPDTTLNLAYSPKAVQPDLSMMPYPFYDELGYGSTRIGYLAPTTLSDDSLSALGVMVAGMAQKVSWHALKPFLADSSSLNQDENLILVGTPTENPTISQLSAGFPLPLQGGKFSDKSSGKTLADNAGVIFFMPHPMFPSRSILVVSGNTPAGVLAAARVLMQNPPNKLLVGKYAIVTEQHNGPVSPYRAWDGFVQHTGALFSELGLQTLSVRGITSLPIFYKLRLMPDLYLPGKTKAHINTIFSYSSQLDPTQSKLEIRLNGKPVKSIRLDNPRGENLAQATVDIPGDEIYTFNDLEYKFHLYPEKYNICNYVTDVHIWGTVHSNTHVDVPGEIKAALPDIGLINDAGYPFTGHQDLSKLGIVLPQTPTTTDLESMVQVLSRLGRVSSSKTGINLTVSHANSISNDIKKDSHLIAIGPEDRNALTKELHPKLHLIISGNTQSLKEADKKLAELDWKPGQGILEEMLSPWNDQRVILMISGATDEAVAQTNRLFEEDKPFGQIQSGNVLVMNPTGPKSVIALEKGQAKFFYPADVSGEKPLPTWMLIGVGFLALIGAIALLRFLFVR